MCVAPAVLSSLNRCLLYKSYFFAESRLHKTLGIKEKMGYGWGNIGQERGVIFSGIQADRIYTELMAF